jgi:hypothetical protein
VFDPFEVVQRRITMSTLTAKSKIPPIGLLEPEERWVIRGASWNDYQRLARLLPE